MKNAHDLLQGCHRSHPHEEMNADCERLTEIARAKKGVHPAALTSGEFHIETLKKAPGEFCGQP